ncbi:MAG TPA: glycosyltransferase family 39 protein [Candidatus Binataceae bacterium]|nr:glycosyltransferase family 39 protein [Candidatus Binataceae bacterium]
MALLAVAIALGAWLRFAAVGANEMSADEGASWAAAAAPSLAEVVRIQAMLNPGKLAVYEILLHGWMMLFGDGLGAMRALSAMFDTFSIVVVFALVRELLGARLSPQTESAGFEGLPPREAETVAAFAAMLFAVDLVMIKYARELRMYPLALLIVLLQVWFFIRALRRGSLFNLAPLAVLTALAVATHFSAAFMVVTEALCLVALPLMPGLRARPLRMARPFAVAAALGGGAALFLIVALPALRTGASAFAQGATGWIERPRWWAPLSLFNKGVGSFAFPVMAALAGWGAWRGWVRARAATAFALAWMWTPPLLMLVASYAFSPMFVERYALWCFVPFFMLAALGAWELRIASIRRTALGAIGTIGAVGLSVALALGHLHTYRRRPHDTLWCVAARAAADALAPGVKIAVAPPYAVNVMRYYLRNTQAAGAAVPAGDSDAGNSDTDVLVVGDQWHAREKAAKLLAQYPHARAGFRGVRVYGRNARAARPVGRR